MSRVVFDGTMHVYFCPTVVSKAAPTVANITAGEDITAFLPKDGLSFSPTDNRVDTGDMSTLFDSQIMGTYGYELSLTMFRDDTDDLAWETFTHKEEGFLVFSPFGPAGAADPVHVFPVEAGQRQLANSAANERQTFTVQFAVTSEPALDAVVAA